MSTVTYFVAQPFEITKKGRFVPRQPEQALTAASAVRRAERLAKVSGGAIAFSRTGDPDFGEFDDAVIIASFGSVPEDFGHEAG